MTCDTCFGIGDGIPFVCYSSRCKEENDCSQWWFCSRKCHNEFIAKQNGNIYNQPKTVSILVCHGCGYQTEHDDKSVRPTLTCLSCYLPMKKMKLTIF